MIHVSSRGIFAAVAAVLCLSASGVHAEVVGTASAPSQRYALQLGAFNDEFQAVLWRQHLHEQGIATTIASADKCGGYLCIRTGSFADKKAAYAAEAKLMDEKGIVSSVVAE